ncbi:MAG: cyclic nucleotide-binding domain-containing protein [Acidimicrobiales bacterium]
MTDTDIKAGTTLMREGENPSSFIVIVSGSAEVSRNGEVVATLTDGAMVGEMAILMDRPRSATVTTITDCEILVGERRAFDGLLDDVPGLARKVLRSLALRVADNEAHDHH